MENKVTTPTPTTKRERKPRNTKDLRTASIKSMSEAELRKALELTRKDLAEVTTRSEAYQRNCVLAYDKVRALEQRHQAFKNKARSLLHFTRQAVSTCNTAIHLAGDLEDN